MGSLPLSHLGSPLQNLNEAENGSPLILALEDIGMFDLQGGEYPRVPRATYKTEKEKQQNVYF